MTSDDRVCATLLVALSTVALEAVALPASTSAQPAPIVYVRCQRTDDVIEMSGDVTIDGEVQHVTRTMRGFDAHDQLRVAVMWWREGWFAEQRPSLIASIERGGPERVITLADQRDDERAGSYSLTGDPAAVYLAAFEKPISIRRLGGVCPGVDVAGIVERFVSRGVMMRDGNLVLALAVPDDAAAWLSACDDFCTAVYASQDDESTSAAITLGREAGLVGQSMV